MNMLSYIQNSVTDTPTVQQICNCSGY